MKRILWLVSLILIIDSIVVGQTKSTQELHEKYEDAFTLFFYKSTLKMLTPENNQEFRDLIGSIEKAKLLRVEKDSRFEDGDVAKYISDIKNESFEEAMTVRHDGNNMNIYIKEDDGETKGIILLMDSEGEFSILDIVGSVDLGKISLLAQQIDF